jgi:hypothetical protein
LILVDYQYSIYLFVLLINVVGFGGKTNLERARIAMILDCLADVAKGMYPIYNEKDETKKAELVAKLSEDIKTHLKNFEKFVIENGHSHFVGSSVSSRVIEMNKF